MSERSTPPLLGNLLRAPAEALNRRIAAEIARHGYDDFRLAHFTVFQHLPHEGLTATALAERAQMTKQSMGELVEHLVHCGYLARSVDPRDRRARLIHYTARGLALEGVAREAIRQQEAEWAAALGPVRFAALRDTLADLAALLRDPAAPPA